ncbi:MAG: STAS-like domain-containing protein [Alteromonadaceae bacterium]|nr:STAS-like domain-containing protein [Alteromonadaceae bacterium]
MEHKNQMSECTIKVVDWHATPKFRFRKEYEFCGEAFRDDILIPALKSCEHVHVDLTGYNRYGPSFIDEAFANIVRNKVFSAEYLSEHLTYSHQHLKRVVDKIDEKIEKARLEVEERNV